MECHACGSENNTSALFCAQCGIKLSTHTTELPFAKKDVRQKRKNKSTGAANSRSKVSPLFIRMMFAFAAIVIVIILIETKENRTNSATVISGAQHFQLDRSVQVIATADHRNEILSNFICPCGNCSDNLKDCSCSHPNGATDIKSFVDKTIAEQKYTTVQIIDMIKEKYVRKL